MLFGTDQLMNWEYKKIYGQSSMSKNCKPLLISLGQILYVLVNSFGVSLVVKLKGCKFKFRLH